MSKSIFVIYLFLALAAPLFGQDFRGAAASGQRDLNDANIRLEQSRQRIADARIPLSNERNRLVGKVLGLRREMEQASRLRDNKSVDLQGIEQEIKKREDEVSYLKSLMGDYIQRFESQIHVSERQIYQEMIDTAKATNSDSSLTEQEKLLRQVSVVDAALDRMEGLSGGYIFEGNALSTEKVLEAGVFTLVGPVALFSGKNGVTAGEIVLEHDSNQPIVYTIGEEASANIRQISESSTGSIPVDPTLGSARLVIQTKETFWEHVQKGGVVIYFILGLAALALLIAFFKWIEISGVKRARPEDLHDILDMLRTGEKEEALAKAKTIKGPVGLLLTDAVNNSEESKDLLEEVLYERLLQTQPKLERLIPFIAVVAATAPLLGLLGTVTGMIKTFKLITVFGTGDARSLSSGISEALITTEFGLFVAIPALIIHALLLRKTKGVLASMEQTAVAFKNGLETKI